MDSEYGELVVLGYRSYRKSDNAGRNLWEPVGKANSKFILRKEIKDSGPSPKRQIEIWKSKSSKDTFYKSAQKCTEVFQLGRMPGSTNDFVVPGPLYGSSGTVSRYAARLICSHDNPKNIRLHAGGYDDTGRLVISHRAPKRCRFCSKWFTIVPDNHPCSSIVDNNSIDDFNDAQWDALTKNGVRIWVPADKRWFEVSVAGRLYPLDNVQSMDNNLSRQKQQRPTGDPYADQIVLTDGCIIDLGGVHLQFLQKDDLAAEYRPSLICITSRLESLNIQCPVHLHSLHFQVGLPSGSIDEDSLPHVYPNCGHVFGFSRAMETAKLCPLCRTQGPLRRLLIVEDSDLDDNITIPECVFNPCGHAVSTTNAEHYSKLQMPNGRSICPYCGIHLSVEAPYAKLYFYTETGDKTTAA